MGTLNLSLCPKCQSSHLTMSAPATQPDDPMTIFQPHPTLHFLNTPGSCLCGTITYTLHGPLIYHTLCSCPHCRRATGSLIGCETLLPTSTLTILTGHSSLTTYEDTQTESGVPLQRQFCSKCGSQMFARTALMEDAVSVFAGGWVRDGKEWWPMREQFAGSSVVSGWMKVLSSIVRTVTGPLSQVMRTGDDDALKGGA